MPGKSRRRFFCIDCKVDTGKICEYYFVHTALWLSVMPSVKEMLCIGCLEKRLGRELRASDFPNVYINTLRHSPKSERLHLRLTAR